MKKVSLFLVFCCLAVKALALSNGEISLPANSVLQANFIQKRHLNKIPKPIESKGHMILWDGKGLIWSTSTPFPNTLLMTPKGLYQLENGLKISLIKAGSDATLFNVMASILNRRGNEAIKGFTTENLSPQEGKWRVSLVPQHKQVLNVIHSIRLEGNTQITNLIIARPNGDRDEIEFRNHAIHIAAPEEIRKLFDE